MFNWDVGIAWSDLIGMAGVAVYIFAYFGLQAGFIRGQGYLYASLNAGAATLVLLSLAENFNLSAAAIQVTFILISAFGIIRFYLLTRRVSFSEEEMILLGVLAPNLDKLQARRLIDLGKWDSLDSGDVLIDEGGHVENIRFLLDGGADVTVGEKHVGTLEPHALAGEMSWITGAAASATVTLARPSRVFSLNTDALKAFLARNPSARHELQARFANQLGSKLLRVNEAMSRGD